MNSESYTIKFYRENDYYSREIRHAQTERGAFKILNAGPNLWVSDAATRYAIWRDSLAGSVRVETRSTIDPAGKVILSLEEIQS